MSVKPGEVHSAVIENEMTVNPSRHISDEIYVERLKESLRQMGRVLKADRWLTLIYANTNLLYWRAVLEAADESGLSFVNLVPQPSTLKQFKKYNAPGSTTSDNLMVNFQKKKLAFRRSSVLPLTNATEYLKLEVERCIVECLGASTDEIAAHLANWILSKEPTAMQYDSIGSLMGLLRKHFYIEREGSDEGRWFHFPGDEIHDKLPWIDRVRYSIYNMLREGEEKTLEEINAYIAGDYALEKIKPHLPSIETIVKNIAETDGEGAYHLSRNLVTQYRLRLQGLLPSRVDDLLKSLVQKSAAEYKPLIDKFEPIIQQFKAKRPSQLADFLALVEAFVVAIRRLQDFGNFIDQVICIGPLFTYGSALDDYVLMVVVKSDLPSKLALFEKLAREVFIPVLDMQGVDLKSEVKTLDEHLQTLKESDDYKQMCQDGITFRVNADG